MTYHWVSQNQTGNHEVPGGYMWCPQTNIDGSRSVNYEMMRGVNPGDVVFSFRNRMITHIGIVVSKAFEARKPTSFGRSGSGWLDLGWKVVVEYEAVGKTVIPSEYMNVLGPLLPRKYSPLQKNGNGNQIYFTTLDDRLGEALLVLTGITKQTVEGLVEALSPMIENSEAFALREAETIVRLEEERIENLPIEKTSKLALIASRVGQGAYRNAVLGVEPRCRVTGVSVPSLLRASHIKPWHLASDQERLDKYNGLMLTPTIDLLFDRGYISFSKSSDLMFASEIDESVFKALGIPAPRQSHVGPFKKEQQRYLEYHRDSIYRG